jgi:hypothetical protein
VSTEKWWNDTASGYGEMVEWYWEGQPKYSRWIRPRTSVSATNLTYVDFRYHPHPCSERPTTNHLCHGRPSLLVFVSHLVAKLRSSIGTHGMSQNVLSFMSFETKTYFIYKLHLKTRKTVGCALSCIEP